MMVIMPEKRKWDAQCDPLSDTYNPISAKLEKQLNEYAVTVVDAEKNMMARKRIKIPSGGDVVPRYV